VSFDKTVRLWDAVTGALLQTLKGHSSLINLVAFSPDGKQVASGSFDKTVRLWDAVIGALLQTLEGYLSSVRSVAFSPNGKQVASGLFDKTVRLWDAVTGALLQTLKGYSSLVRSVAFSPNGKQVALGLVNSVAFLQGGKVEYSLFILNDWLIEGKEKFLWLPLEYQVSSIAIWNKTIILGHLLGRISIFGFKKGLKHIL
jgi:WD40 repeat protein